MIPSRLGPGTRTRGTRPSPKETGPGPTRSFRACGGSIETRGSVDRIFRIHQTPRTPRTFGQLEASRSFGIAALWRRIRQLARLKAESARLWRLLAEDQDEIEGLWKDLRGVRGCRGLDSDRSAERGLGGIGSPSGEPELEKLELESRGRVVDETPEDPDSFGSGSRGAGRRRGKKGRKVRAREEFARNGGPEAREPQVRSGSRVADGPSGDPDSLESGSRGAGRRAGATEVGRLASRAGSTGKRTAAKRGRKIRARENRSRRSGAEARQRGVNGEPEGETEKVFPARQISAVETRETRECRAFEVRPPPGECRAFQVRPSSGKTLRQSLEIFRESCEPGLEELGETELGVTTSRPRPSRPRRPNPTLPRLGLGPGLRDRIRPEANETSLEYLEELEGVEAC